MSKQNHTKLKQYKYLKKLFWIFLLVLILVSIYLLDNPPTSISYTNTILALGITWMGLIPSLEYIANPQRPPFPFFPMVGLYYGLAYGLPMFASDFAVHYRFPLSKVSNEALLLTFFGIAGMNASFFISKSLLWKKVSTIRVTGKITRNKLLILAWLLLIGHLGNITIPYIREIPSLTQFLEPSKYIAYGIFYILFKYRALPRTNILPLFLVTFLIIAINLATGLMAQLILLIVFLIILIWYETKRLPIITITILILMMLILNPVKGQYRASVNNGATGIQSIENSIKNSQAFVKLAFDSYQNDSKNNLGNTLDNNSGLASVINRTAYINILSEVVKDTPARVPYWNGQTYMPLFTKFVPRFLWPDKPTDSICNEFGRRYSYFGNRNDFSTCFRVPWIVEMYANFGAEGVLFGMPLCGLLLSFLDQKFNQPSINFLEFLLGATILLQLVYQEANFSLMIGNALLLPISFLLLFRFWFK